MPLALAAACLALAAPPGAERPDEPAPFHAYWLTGRAGPDHGYLTLLVTRGPITRPTGTPSVSPPQLFDRAGFTFQTYGKDSFWAAPFQPVKAFGAPDAAAKTVTLDGADYSYEPCPLADVVRLLDKPWGTLLLHRGPPPLDGATQTAKAFRSLLVEQMGGGPVYLHWFAPEYPGGKFVPKRLLTVRVAPGAEIDAGAGEPGHPDCNLRGRVEARGGTFAVKLEGQYQSSTLRFEGEYPLGRAFDAGAGTLGSAVTTTRCILSRSRDWAEAAKQAAAAAAAAAAP